MYIAQFIVCIAQACIVLEQEYYTIYKDQQSCEALAVVKAEELVALLKDKDFEAVGFRCIDKTDSGV